MLVYTSRFSILLADAMVYFKLLAGSGVSPAAFKSLYPIYVFDVWKQSEQWTEGVVDLTARVEFEKVITTSSNGLLMDGKTWTTLHVPTRYYELMAINAEIIHKGGTPMPNINTLQCILIVAGV